MRELGVHPLTWTYVKLFGRQLQQNVRDWDGLPNSHAWAATRSSPPQRLLTKAQCVGVLVSIHQRAERVELLVDDGTALVRAVLWAPSWDEGIALGELVRVEGKLNMDTSWANDTKTGDHLERELRVVRITKIDDPNEELLHWLDVAQLTTQIYNKQTKKPTTEHTAPTTTTTTTTTTAHSTTAPTRWDSIVMDAFHNLTLDENNMTAFLTRSDKSPHDGVLISTLQQLLTQQLLLLSSTDPLRVVFPDLLRDRLAKEGIAAEDALHHALTRSLRYAFATLRSAGLLHLENTESDQYLLLSADRVLAPALVHFLQRKRPDGCSMPEIADWVLTQPRFRRLSIDSLERTLQAMTQTGVLQQQSEDSQVRFIYCELST